jgi:eukaryotic-like serine/threonine-protein kinase
MAAEAERNLLFGLIALQVGLIDQSQLVAAFQAWARHKVRTLSDHLGDLGVLDADARAAVEVMVVLHLRKHEGDLEKSLVSLPVGHSTRERLAGLCDAELDASLQHVASCSTEPIADRTATFSVGALTADGQRFRVLRARPGWSGGSVRGARWRD